MSHLLKRPHAQLVRHIWVPGERSENGVIVLDALDEEVKLSAEKGEKMRVPSKFGGTREVLAARGELLRVEETRRGKQIARVRLVGGAEVQVMVLGPWQLEGKKGPSAEDAE